MLSPEILLKLTKGDQLHADFIAVLYRQWLEIMILQRYNKGLPVLYKHCEGRFKVDPGQERNCGKCPYCIIKVNTYGHN